MNKLSIVWREEQQVFDIHLPQGEEPMEIQLIVAGRLDTVKLAGGDMVKLILADYLRELNNGS